MQTRFSERETEIIACFFFNNLSPRANNELLILGLGQLTPQPPQEEETPEVSSDEDEDSFKWCQEEAEIFREMSEASFAVILGNKE